MKDSKIYAKKISKLYREMKKEHAKVKTVNYEDPIDAIVFGILCEFQSLPAARTSLRRINKHFVDLNDLRVSRAEEVVEVLGGDGEEIHTIADELSRSLNAIYYKFDSVTLMPLKEEGKRQARKELEELGKISSFVVSYCFLTALSGHAIPVSQSIVDFLKVEELVHPRAKASDIEGFLERQNKSDDAFEFFMLLKTHTDSVAKKTAKKLAKIVAIEDAKKAKKNKKKTNKKTAVKTKAKEAAIEEKTVVEKADKKAVKKAAKKAPKKTEKKSEKKSVKKTGKKSVKKAETKVVKKTAKKAAKKTVEKTAKKAVKKTVKKAAKKTAKKKTKKA
jgi:outer membrane biosynthesis protein TonB